MTNKSFAELTKQVHLLHDLILSDMICGNADYSEEFLNFSRHLCTTKYWFVRISWANKRRYILALMEDVKSAWALSLLLKSLWNCRPKDAVLSASLVRPWSVYDQAPLDHNRTALPVQTLGQVMTNDRKWFHFLNPEYQALVLSELLTIAGGPAMWEVLRRGQHIFERSRNEQLKNLLECIVVDQTPPPPVAKLDEAPVEKSKPRKASKEKEELTTMMQTEEEESVSTSTAAPSTPPPPVVNPVVAQKNLETCLEAWNTIIKNLRDSQKLEELEMTFEDGSKQKIWKVNRVKPEGVETVDFVQLLPSAIGKKIISSLPFAQLGDYAKVNKYWAYLIDEYKAELVARNKLNADKEKLQDAMLKHDTSLEVLAPSGVVLTAGSIAPSVEPSSRRIQPSYKASERSAGGISFRHQVVDKLKPEHKIKPKPIRKLADLTDRLERRGAADENLWEWCENALKYCKGPHPKPNSEEGVLKCSDVHFPCPLMKHSVELPLRTPLAQDPAHSTAGLPKVKRNFSYSPVNTTTRDADSKKFSLWSRDFSSLYKVFKVAAYQSPV